MKSWQDIPGWFDFPDIYDEAVARVPDGGTLVEIGCWLGRSSAYLHTASLASGKQLQLVFVDRWTGVTGPAEHERWDGDDMKAAWFAHMDAVCAKSPRIKWRVFPMDSVQASKRFRGKADFIFLDGAHDYDSVTADLEAWLPRLAPTGHIAGHDYGHPEVKQAVARLLTVRARGASWERVPQ